MEQIKQKTDIVELFNDAKYRQTYLKICAPMVRYSKLEFRKLVRKYGVDLCYTPMIMTDSFCQSEKARLNEFSTSRDDTPLIAQFAANNVHEYLSCAEMVYPYVDGIDLNCGCPQRWAMSEGYGSALLNDPQLMKDLASTIRRNFPNNFSVSVKIRVQKPISKTLDLCRQLEKCGITFLTVHGRTPNQKISELSNNEYLREIKQSLSIPLVANGDCKSLDDAENMFNKINCDGVMAARAMLSNPTLFSGKYETTPLSCVQEWINIGYAADEKITFQCFQHHLTFMMEKMLKRKERAVFNSLSSKEQIYEYLNEKFDIVPETSVNLKLINCEYDETNYRERVRDLKQQERLAAYNAENNPGKFFLSQINDDDVDDVDDCGGLEFMDSGLFDT